VFVNVGRFRFRPMDPDGMQRIVDRIEQDVPPVARASRGFRAVYFARPSADEVMAVWLWDTEEDWEAAFPRFLPALQEYVVPNLVQPPERVSGEVVVQALEAAGEREAMTS
jgi:hypothetical protein